MFFADSNLRVFLSMLTLLRLIVRSSGQTICQLDTGDMDMVRSYLISPTFHYLFSNPLNG